MGAIKTVLDQRELPERELHNSRLFIDLSENVHIHFREIRLMFSVPEFFEFSDVLRESAGEVRRWLARHPEYREQQVFDGLLVAGGVRRQTTPLLKSPKPHESTYFPNRLQIELQEESVIDSVHIHFRDYRLAMSIECFREFARGMREALDKLETELEREPYDQKAHPFRQVVEAEGWNQERIGFWYRLKRRLRQFLGRGGF